MNLRTGFLRHFLLQVYVWVLAAVSAFSVTTPVQAQFRVGSSTTVDKVIAKVDNFIILKSDLEVGYLQAIQGGTKDLRGNLKCQVLEQLVVSKLMLAKAEMDSVTVDKKLVEEQLDRRMQYMISVIGSKEKLENYYNKTVDQFKSELRKQVKEQMVVQKMQDQITKDIKVTPAQVKRYFISIPKDSLPYYSTEVEIGQIVRTPKIGKGNKAVAKRKLAQLRERIVKGEDFETLAKQYSEDPGSAKEGGNLGFWGKGAMVPEYEAAALKLKPGELSEIVESAFGFHLIQLIEKRGAEYNSRHILIKPASTGSDIEETKAFLDSLRLAIQQDSTTFEKAAQKFSEDATTKANGGLLVDNATSSTRIPLENLDPTIYFIIDTMKVGQISKPLPFRTDDNKDALRIIYYKSKTPPHEANLKDDYQKMYNVTLARKKNQAMQEWFEKAKNDVFIHVDSDYSRCRVLESKKAY